LGHKLADTFSVSVEVAAELLFILQNAAERGLARFNANTFINFFGPAYPSRAILL
jgi:hypothetical protein